MNEIQTILLNDYTDNTTLKAECVALNCSYGCKPTPVGPSCYCQSGQQPNGTFCEGLKNIYFFSFFRENQLLFNLFINHQFVIRA